MKNNWIEKLKEQNACRDSLAWTSKQESPQAAWNACERGDWMLWAWGRNCGKVGSKSHRQLVIACVGCSRTSLKYVKDKEIKKLVKKSLDTTERWARGEEGVTLKDVENATDSTWNADWSNAGNAAAYVSAAARSARYAAVAVTYSAAASAAASAVWTSRAAGYATGYATDTDAAAAARTKALKKCADIIRTIQQKCPRFKRVTG